MKAREIMEELFALEPRGDYAHTCDTWKAGDPERETRKIAVAMFPTVSVLRQAAKWGADLLIVHEPLYYDHMDAHSGERIETEKRALAEQTGMAICRYHDHAHRMPRDLIAEGEYELLGLEGEMAWGAGHDLVRVRLSRPMTPRALAARIEEKLGIRHVRVCGAADTPCGRVSSLFGAPGNAVFDELRREESQIVITGEACEWMAGEYARDAAQLGYQKALLILGHVGSEEGGMRLLARKLQEAHPEIGTRFFPCGEVYVYPENGPIDAAKTP